MQLYIIPEPEEGKLTKEQKEENRKTVLNSIMHSVLKPWKLDTTNTKRFTDLVKAAKAASPNTNAELLSQLTTLLVDYPTLQKILADETKGNAPLQQLIYKTDLPKYKDAVTHFFYFVITGETIRDSMQYCSKLQTGLS